MPFSDAPVLEIGGRVVLQTSAITRFVAVHCRLVPIVHAEQTVAESVVDSAIELRTAGFQAFFDDSLKVRSTVVHVISRRILASSSFYMYVLY